ncbi:hypothetical protein [Halalkalicoccus sp. NIPERK01]|uniref:hypothetical protein n=1 Tax=Halalkalicoccus sp. NIPERK01 TaxID=3053469 RepID=UPI00256F4527|nr:hypothetical protein [Halalkalicoccus sp. NIPERK01]MDL5362932.1 hypothetical protein [Halalkalicoccus sp. NIPERK01]
MDSRWLTALGGLLASLAISVLAWVYFDTLLVFLLIPFVPFLFRRSPPTKRCPRCGFETTSEGFEYCPRDGTRLP